jgi:cytochrome c2
MIKRTVQFGVSSFISCALLFGAGAGRAPAQTKGDAAKGKEVFEQCSVCHNVDTDEKKMGPSLKGLFKREKLANGKKVSDDTVLEQINNGGNGMPAYADMLSAEDKANVLAYLHTL